MIPTIRSWLTANAVISDRAWSRQAPARPAAAGRTGSDRGRGGRGGGRRRGRHRPAPRRADGAGTSLGAVVVGAAAPARDRLRHRDPLCAGGPAELLVPEPSGERPVRGALPVGVRRRGRLRRLPDRHRPRRVGDGPGDRPVPGVRGRAHRPQRARLRRARAAERGADQRALPATWPTRRCPARSRWRSSRAPRGTGWRCWPTTPATRSPRCRCETASGGWISLARASYNYWIAQSGAGTGPFTVRLTDTEGHQVTVHNVALDPGAVQSTGVYMYGAGSDPAPRDRRLRVGHAARPPPPRLPPPPLASARASSPSRPRRRPPPRSSGRGQRPRPGRRRRPLRHPADGRHPRCPHPAPARSYGSSPPRAAGVTSAAGPSCAGERWGSCPSFR